MTDIHPGWMDWVQSSNLDELWPGAADFTYGDLQTPLLVAAIQCERFAPAVPYNQPLPKNYLAAQILQTRALVRAGVVGDRDDAGGFGETVTVFPMDWTVKNLLRPRRGRPYFGGRRAQS